MYVQYGFLYLILTRQKFRVRSILKKSYKILFRTLGVIKITIVSDSNVYKSPSTSCYMFVGKIVQKKIRQSIS
jgi:hypothetical protein